MKTLNECLDHVLQTLMDNEGAICLMCIDKIHRNNKDETLYKVSDEYNKMYKPLCLNDSQFVELLQILKEREYIEYDVLEIKPNGYSNAPVIDHSAIWFRNMETGKISNEGNAFEGYRVLFGSRAVHLRQCQKVQITLRGKFYFEQGGFQGEENEKNEEKNRIRKQDEQIRLLTVFLAIGSIGVLIIEALKFLLDYF